MATTQTNWLAGSLPLMAELFISNDNKGTAIWRIARADGKKDNAKLTEADFTILENIPAFASRTSALIASAIGEKIGAKSREGAEKGHMALWHVAERKTKSGTIIPAYWQTVIPVSKISAADKQSADTFDAELLNGKPDKKPLVKRIANPKNGAAIPSANAKAEHAPKASPAQMAALKAQEEEQRKAQAIAHAQNAQQAA